MCRWVGGCIWMWEILRVVASPLCPPITKFTFSLPPPLLPFVIIIPSNCSALGRLCHLALLPAAMVEVLLWLIVVRMWTSASAVEARANRRQIGGLVVGQCDEAVEFELGDADLQLLVGAALLVVLIFLI